MLFRTKSETTRDKAVDHAQQAGGAVTSAGEHAGQSLKALAGSLVHAVSGTVGSRGDAAPKTALKGVAAASVAAKGRKAAQDRATEAKERVADTRMKATAGVGAGLAALAGRSGSNPAPKIDDARDTLSEDIMPKLQEILASLQSAKEDVLKRESITPGPAAAASAAAAAAGRKSRKDRKKSKRKGGFLTVLGVLSGIGAAVSYYLSKKKSGDDATDPWAASSTRPIGGAPGVDSQVRSVGTTTTSTTTGTVGTSTPSRPPETGDKGRTVVPGTTTPITTGSDPDQEAEMIDIDDIPGTDPDARTGFGTDFGVGGEKPRD